jgi:DNA-directed RNA polymerase specialized sigma subunit
VTKESKPSEKKLRHECPTCNEEIIKRDGRYCLCWENLLPKTKKSSVAASSVGENIERASVGIDDWGPSKEISQEQLVSQLRAFGLETYEIELIRDRYFSELKWEEIVEKRGWASSGAASYVHKRILAKLRKAGFNWK